MQPDSEKGFGSTVHFISSLLNVKEVKEFCLAERRKESSALVLLSGCHTVCFSLWWPNSKGFSYPLKPPVGVGGMTKILYHDMTQTIIKCYIFIQYSYFCTNIWEEVLIGVWYDTYMCTFQWIKSFKNERCYHFCNFLFLMWTRKIAKQKISLFITDDGYIWHPCKTTSCYVRHQLNSTLIRRVMLLRNCKQLSLHSQC